MENTKRSVRIQGGHVVGPIGRWHNWSLARLVTLMSVMLDLVLYG